MTSPARIATIIVTTLMVTVGAYRAYGQNRYENSANYVSALKALQEERYKEAYDFLSKEVAVHPDNGYAYILLARFHTAVNDYEDAIEDATEAINNLPATDIINVARAYVARANAKVALDQQSALDDFNRAIDLCPKEIEFLLSRANYFHFCEKFDESDSDYRRTLALESDNATAQIGLGRNKIGRKDYQEAVSYFTRIQPNFPKNSDIYAFRAQAYFALEKYENSATDLVKALSIDGNERAFRLLSAVAPHCLSSTVAKLEKEMQKKPEEPLYPLCIGMVYEDSDKYSNAISAYKKAYNLDKNSELAKRISDCYLELGDLDNANKYIDYAIELNADEPSYYASKASICLSKEDYQGAIEQINIAIEKDGSNAANYFVRGWIKGMDEDYDGALEDYTKCISIDDAFTPAYLERGRIYQKRGYMERVRRDFEKCVELDTDGDEGIAYYALAYLGRKEEAIASIQKGLEKKSSASTLYNASCVYSILDEKEAGIEYLEKAIKAGYRDFKHIADDPDLDNIRGEEGYKRIVATYITKMEYVDESNRLKEMNIAVFDDSAAEETASEEAPVQQQGTGYGKEYSFTYTTSHGVNKVASQLNGLPLSITFINSNAGVNISVYEANFLLNNRFISSSDIIKNDPKTAGIPVGSTVVLHQLVLGDITLTNIRARVVTNDNIPFSFGLKLFSSYTNISVQNDTVTMNKK